MYKAFLLGLVLAMGISFTQAKPHKKPNIVLFFADDISAREIPIYGSSAWSHPPQGGTCSDPKYRAKTPVLDRLAHEGLWIKTAWAATVCMPSRSQMMSGRYAHIHKWWHNKDKGQWTDPSGKSTQYPVTASSPHSIAKVAKAGGYTTMWAGKTQMGEIETFGFDEGCFTPGVDEEKNTYTDFKILQSKKNGKRILTNTDTGEKVDYYQQFGWYFQPHVTLMNHPSCKETFETWPNTDKARKAYGLHTYGPDVELEYVLDFMERKVEKDEPFFVYHTTHLGHDGWDFLSPDINKKTRQKWPGTPKISWDGKKYERTQPHITGDKGQYNTHGTITEGGIHSHINYIDYQVWQYINKFKELDIDDNTVFIFCADNGTSGYGKSSPVSQKGTHIPMIIYAPCLDMTKQGAQDVLVNVADMLPTIADIAGVQIPESYEINGESLMPFLTTNKSNHREWIYAYHMDKQLIRGNNVLIDGNGKIYNVAEYPEDLISFPVINDWSKVSEAHNKEYQKLMQILPRFNLHDKEHDAPSKEITAEPLTTKH